MNEQELSKVPYILWGFMIPIEGGAWLVVGFVLAWGGPFLAPLLVGTLCGILLPGLRWYFGMGLGIVMGAVSLSVFVAVLANRWAFGWHSFIPPAIFLAVTLLLCLGWAWIARRRRNDQLVGNGNASDLAEGGTVADSSSPAVSCMGFRPMKWIPIKPCTWRSTTPKMSGCRWSSPRLTIRSLVVVHWWTATEWVPAFRSLLVGLAAVALVTSCGNDAVVSPAPAVETPSLVGSGVEGGSSEPVFPRHGEPVLINRGNYYVYGELSLSGDCLRISYVDQVDREATRDGLLLVWPEGFDVRANGDVAEVIGADGGVAAAVGQTLRVSGKRVPDNLATVDEWDWHGGDVGHCAGPFWLVGDEVTAMMPKASDVASDDDIFFPRLSHQRGSIVSTSAGVEGRLALRGRCLLLEVPHPPGEYFVVWPPGFNVQMMGDDFFVLNGGGSVIAKVGDDVMLGGNSGTEGANYSDECQGAYFKAYSVQRSTAR